MVFSEMSQTIQEHDGSYPVCSLGRAQAFGSVSPLASLPGRLTAGHQVLVLSIGVRIPAREPLKTTSQRSCRPEKACFREVGNILPWNQQNFNLTSDSLFTLYIHYIEGMIKSLTKRYEDVELPKFYNEAIEEYQNKKQALTELFANDPVAAARQFVELGIVKLLIPPAPVVILQKAITGLFNPGEGFIMTSSLDRGGNFALVDRSNNAIKITASSPSQQNTGRHLGIHPARRLTR